MFDDNIVQIKAGNIKRKKEKGNFNAQESLLCVRMRKITGG